MPLPPSSSPIRSAASSPPLTLSVATNDTISLVARPESMTTVGMPARFASSTGRTSAFSSSGASTMPETPWLRKPSTTWTCCSRSSSRSGPFQVMVTFTPFSLSSRSAFTAPAWMAFQNSCVVPLGMTPIVSGFPRRGRAPSTLRARCRSNHCQRPPPPVGHVADIVVCCHHASRSPVGPGFDGRRAMPRILPARARWRMRIGIKSRSLEPLMAQDQAAPAALREFAIVVDRPTTSPSSRRRSRPGQQPRAARRARRSRSPAASRQATGLPSARFPPAPSSCSTGSRSARRAASPKATRSRVRNMNNDVPVVRDLPADLHTPAPALTPVASCRPGAGIAARTAASARATSC